MSLIHGKLLLILIFASRLGEFSFVVYCFIVRVPIVVTDVDDFL